ncbi:hypothetical protein KZ780_31045 [Mycolicibacterium smegmatis]|uniref:hypothetical protein n=1 Tax=Mycolicibacterium smegmatis TaxID=1772 RepID=UPI001EFABD94|nr:hypothetical protein [Mycolicibacterium smegmatis]ULN28728.1 hypothetical protein KZ780_31045 [Mycolicibacterium smegmatis]
MSVGLLSLGRGPPHQHVGATRQQLVDAARASVTIGPDRQHPPVVGEVRDAVDDVGAENLQRPNPLAPSQFDRDAPPGHHVVDDQTRGVADHLGHVICHHM